MRLYFNISYIIYFTHFTMALVNAYGRYLNIKTTKDTISTLEQQTMFICLASADTFHNIFLQNVAVLSLIASNRTLEEVD